MVKFEIGVQINRPLPDVFAYMNDPAKLPEWNSIVLEARALETPIRAGTKVQQRARFLGRNVDSTFEVAEYEVNKRAVNRYEKPFPLTTTATFEAVDGGTKIALLFEAEPGGFFRIGESILTRIAKKQLQTQLDTARELLEAQVLASR